MTVAEQARVIGKDGLIILNGLGVCVTVIGVKQAYGNTRYQIRAVAGDMRMVWVDASRVKIFEEQLP